MQFCRPQREKKITCMPCDRERLTESIYTHSEREREAPNCKKKTKTGVTIKS